jgi:hypothetical protein
MKADSLPGTGSPNRNTILPARKSKSKGQRHFKSIYPRLGGNVKRAESVLGRKNKDDLLAQHGFLDDRAIISAEDIPPDPPEPIVTEVAKILKKIRRSINKMEIFPMRAS